MTSYLNKNIKLVKESLYEFYRGEDPLKAMGIGKRAKIEQWLKSVGVKPKDYTIDDNLHVTIKRDLDLYDDKTIDWLPDNLNVGRYIWLDVNKRGKIDIPEHLKNKIRYV